MYIRLRQMFGIPANIHSVDRETLEVQKAAFRPENDGMETKGPEDDPKIHRSYLEGGREGGGKWG